MEKIEKILSFGYDRVGSVLDEDSEIRYFDIIDVLKVLVEEADIYQYWEDLKKRISFEARGDLAFIHKATMSNQNTGEPQEREVTDFTGLMRILQSVPSDKVEPMRRWLSKNATEFLEERIDPEKAVLRGVANYAKKGHSMEWIHQRIQSILTRKELTEAWSLHGIEEPLEFAKLTDILSESYSGFTSKQYKKFKGIGAKCNLRDNMTSAENALTNLAEVATTEIINKEHPEGFYKNIDVAKRGGAIARKARENLEAELGYSVISKENNLHLNSKKNTKKLK